MLIFVNPSTVNKTISEVKNDGSKNRSRVKRATAVRDFLRDNDIVLVT